MGVHRAFFVDEAGEVTLARPRDSKARIAYPVPDSSCRAPSGERQDKSAIRRGGRPDRGPPEEPGPAPTVPFRRPARGGEAGGQYALTGTWPRARRSGVDVVAEEIGERDLALGGDRV